MSPSLSVFSDGMPWQTTWLIEMQLLCVVAAIAERRRDRAAVERHLAHHVVERGGGDAGLDQRRQRVEDLGGEPPGAAHALERLGAVELDGPVAQDRFVVGNDLILIHAANIGDGAAECEPVSRVPARTPRGTAASRLGAARA